MKVFNGTSDTVGPFETFYEHKCIIFFNLELSSVPSSVHYFMSLLINAEQHSQNISKEEFISL